jgi:hypothetical protein
MMAFDNVEPIPVFDLDNIAGGDNGLAVGVRLALQPDLLTFELPFAESYQNDRGQAEKIKGQKGQDSSG